ncbi:MAG: helix-turn-helix transcriptional regulator [bacterium]|nr:helix-turn-helix transcriptional regulator [bacterium]
MVRFIYRQLREVRLEKGMTLPQLSSMTGIAQPNLSRIETGKVDARYSTLARIARALSLELALSSPDVLTVADVKARMAEGAQRLAERGIAARDVEQRLAWKRARGVDTSVEQRLLG